MDLRSDLEEVRELELRARGLASEGCFLLFLSFLLQNLSFSRVRGSPVVAKWPLMTTGGSMKTVWLNTVDVLCIHLLSATCTRVAVNSIKCTWVPGDGLVLEDSDCTSKVLGECGIAQVSCRHCFALLQPERAIKAAGERLSVRVGPL